MQPHMFEEFEKMTNAEAYRRAFHELLMLPDPQRPATFLGNSQREEFLPILHTVLNDLKGHQSPNVFDIGAGSGEIVDIALRSLDTATISIEEPNALLLERYRIAVQKHANLKLGSVYPGVVEELYRRPEGKDWFAALPPQDLILAIHMIYHLTPFSTEAPLQPERDLSDLIEAMYGKLSAGGSIVIVYADQLKSMGGKIGYNHFEKRSPTFARNLREIWSARNRLLKDGAIADILTKKYPEATCAIQVHETPSKFFARSLEELTVINLSGELGTADDGPFDVSKLRTAYEFITRFGDQMGVGTEHAGPRKGMVGGNQPQVICKIEKRAR